MHNTGKYRCRLSIDRTVSTFSINLNYFGLWYKESEFSLLVRGEKGDFFFEKPSDLSLTLQLGQTEEYRSLLVLILIWKHQVKLCILTTSMRK